MTRDAILDRAKALIGGDRQDSYGDWHRNAEAIAAGWSVILGHKVEPRRVALMMAWLKIVRQIDGPHEDSAVDLAGYAALGGEHDTD